MRQQAAEIERRLADAFAALYSQGIDANGRTDFYGIRVEGLTDDCASFDLIATFRSGEKYCCMEPGCHFGLLDNPGMWSQIRQVLEDRGLGFLPVLTIRKLRVIVEEGALFDHQRQDYAPHHAFTYDVGSFSEAGPLPEDDAAS